MTKVENIKLENIGKCHSKIFVSIISPFHSSVPIGASDITDHNLTLILALVWTLILRYQMAKGQPDTVESKVEKEQKSNLTADELLLGWE